MPSKYPTYLFGTKFQESSHGVALIPLDKVEATNLIVADANAQIQVVKADYRAGRISAPEADLRIRRIRVHAYLELGKLGGFSTRQKLDIMRRVEGSEL